MSYYPDHPNQECGGNCVTQDCGTNEGIQSISVLNVFSKSTLHNSLNRNILKILKKTMFPVHILFTEAQSSKYAESGPPKNS